MDVILKGVLIGACLVGAVFAMYVAAHHAWARFWRIGSDR